MTVLPIIPHLDAAPPPRLQDAVERLALAVRAERSELALPENLRSLAPDGRTDGPTLHLDDLSEIPRFNGSQDIRFYQDRARLRAGDDDVVASCGDPVAEHESHCRDYLGLGSSQWLRPKLPRVPLRIAEACWEDPSTRAVLLDRLKHDRLAYIHPHMGTRSVWELGLLLQAESKRPLQVIGPAPGLARWVNDKIAFAGIVFRLMGPEFVPRTESACNFAAMAQRVKELSTETQMLGFKLPTSAGGAGNRVVASDTFRGRSLDEIRKLLQYRLRELEVAGWSSLNVTVDG